MKEFKLDQLDMDIIEFLSNNCTLTYEEISVKTGRSIWTVRDRMNLLKQRGIIKGCKADIDYSKMGMKCKAMITFNVPADKIDDFVLFSKKEKGIKKLFIRTGTTRFVITMVGEDCSSLREYARKILPKFNIYDVDFEVVLDEIL
jgi:DNA-binding Lrp family transcriptional regulator